MSERWPGGIVRSTPVTPTGPFQNGTAPGVWTMDQAAYWIKQGLWPIAGNAQLLVEEVFSTWPYTGNGSTQTIANGINLSGQGGLVWAKRRDGGASHILIDTTRGALNYLETNAISAQSVFANSLTGFTSSGYTMGGATNYNGSGGSFVSWTFREAARFFDIVTYTGDGTNNRSIAHNLGATPGMIIVKNTTSTQSWIVYHRSTGTGNYMVLNGTNAVSTLSDAFPSVSDTAFVPTANQSGFALNTSGQTFVAYLFAHDTSSTGIIQCGSFTTSGGGSATVNLGWEPQWLLLKNTANGASNWITLDTMRGMSQTGIDILFPNTSDTETETSGNLVFPTATGFRVANGALGNSAPNIYVAIRRGPMATPTLGTAVFMPVARTGTGSAATVTSVGFPPDAIMSRSRNNGTGIAAFGNMTMFDRLRGVLSSGNPTPYLFTPATQAENTVTNAVVSLNMDGYSLGIDGNIGTSNYSSNENYINYSFRRAPSFFDEVCYTGDGATQTLNHNLSVAPELLIIKRRTGSNGWAVYSAPTGTGKYLVLNDSAAVGTGSLWFDTTPTSTTFTVYANAWTNAANETYVAYLFASCPGVSKVGSYTGNGSSQTINCGFTTGARFVLIKRTDSTGDWCVWDSARGIVASNDPYVTLNATTAETTSNDSVDTDSTGFVVNQVASNINVNGGTYIFLAIS